MFVTIFWCIQHYFEAIFHLLTICFHDFSEKVLPACVGSTILDIDTEHFTSKSHLADPYPCSDPSIDPSCGSRFLALIPALQPWSRQLSLLVWWKNATKVCIKTTGGLLARLWTRFRHNFDDILTYPTPFWRYFDASNTFLKAFSTFSLAFLMIFLKKCSLPT